MKPGDIVMIFLNPIKMTGPIDQARLVKRIRKFTCLEYWEVEYLNEEGHLYRVLIKTINRGEGTKNKIKSAQNINK